MNISVKDTLVICLLLLVPLQKARAQTDASKPRIPTGIYAVVKVEEAAAMVKLGPIAIGGFDSAFIAFYNALLDNPAVSGLALQVQWATLNPNGPNAAGTYSWDYVDDAFSAVNSWNTNHPHAKVKKTIQLIVAPGLNSPQWVKNELTSCDGLFYDPQILPGQFCGKVTFTNVLEAAEADNCVDCVLPLPWDVTYEEAWNAFLTALSTRYNANKALVSIAVAGPTSASAEMLLPNPAGNKVDQAQFEADGGGDLSTNQMWNQLLQNVGLPEPEDDTAFIDWWNEAIYRTGVAFAGVTEVVTTGNGLPNLQKGPFDPPPPFSLSVSPDCQHDPDMDCDAETRILSFFIYPLSAGTNAKATQTSGVKASRTDTDLGLVGVKYLSQYSMGSGSPSTLILGGAQFNEPVSKSPVDEGSSPNIEQALYNVLSDYFTGTPVAGAHKFFGGTSGAAPMNYLQIYYPDIQYATAHVDDAPTSITEEDGTTDSVTFQDLLNKAGDALFGIAETEP